MFYTTKNNLQKPTATHKKKYHHRSKINVIKYVKQYIMQTSKNSLIPSLEEEKIYQENHTLIT